MSALQIGMNTVEYRGVVFSIPDLASDGITFWPEHSILVNAGKHSPILQAKAWEWGVRD